MAAARRRGRWVIAIEAIAAAVMTAVGTWWLRGAVSTWRGAVAIRLGRHPRFLIPPPLR
jgi:hypothetical protein